MCTHDFLWLHIDLFYYNTPPLDWNKILVHAFRINQLYKNSKLRSCVSLNLLTGYRFLDRFKAHTIISIIKIGGGGVLMSKEDFGDGLSPLETLSKPICCLQCIQVAWREFFGTSTKQRSLYFNFLNDIPSPSNSNTTPVSIFVSD